ncbi:hypothetical protein FJY63_11675 [Candidatus Sumerlaeota bacterium]|nr:hypothetical protein [Candidatus Sumerlaeota bacterium]
MLRQVTHCPSYSLVLTRRCANRCGYCGFPISGPDSPPPLRVVRCHLRQAAQLGATQVELIAGEGIANDSAIVETVCHYGFDSYQSYLTEILQMIEATDRRSHLFSLLNIGPLSLAELRMMRPYMCAMRMMLESADPSLQFRDAHIGSPSKAPVRRLEAILACGRAGVPLTTGIIVGIGDGRESRLKAFDIIARAHQRYGHIQAVRVQMFHPIAGTPMGNRPAVGDDEFVETVALARRHFGPTMAIQVSADEHPHLIGPLLDAGVSDLGDIPVRRKSDRKVSPDSLVALAEAEARRRGLRFARRFPVLPTHCDARWYPGGFPTRIPLARTLMAKHV